MYGAWCCSVISPGARHSQSPARRRGMVMEQYNPAMSGGRLKSGVGSTPFWPGSRKGTAVSAAPIAPGRLRGEMKPVMSAASVHWRASRACPRSWDRSIRPSCEYDRTSGIRMFGSRSRTIPSRASTAACDSGGTSGISAARWQKHAQTLPVEIRA